MNRLSILIAVLAGFAMFSGRAEAQLNHGRGTMRFSIDADLLSFAGVERDPPGPGDTDYVVFGLGANQLGGARVSALPTPIGLGFGYVLSPKLIVGGRLGLGYDIVNPDGDENSTRYLGLALNPGVTFVPVGEHRAKLYLNAAPILQIDRAKTERTRDRTILGGLGLGVGALIFIVNDLSFDVGFHLELKAGNEHRTGGAEEHVRDIRGVVRAGISLWK